MCSETSEDIAKYSVLHDNDRLFEEERSEDREEGLHGIMQLVKDDYVTPKIVASLLRNII